MKTLYTLLFAGLLILCSIVYLLPEKSTQAENGRINLTQPETEEEDNDDETRHLAYTEWFEKKKNEEGIIPIGLVSQWDRHDKRFLAEPPIAARSNTLTYLGPDGFGGRTRAILADLGTDGQYFVGGASGGLWRSTDAGASWTAIDDMATTLSVSCITQNPFNTNEIYYGTGEAFGVNPQPGVGVFKSTDGGNTFNLLLATEASNSLEDFAYCTVVKHSLQSSNTLYVGTRNGLFMSTDGGQSWTTEISGYVYDIVTFSDGAVLVTSSLGMFRSSNGTSGSFNAIPDNVLFPNAIRVEIANCPASPNIVYAAFDNFNINGFFRSTDSGQTWEERSIPTFAISTQGGYCFTLGVHTSQPDLIFMGGVYPVTSEDGGNTWSSALNTHLDYQVVELIPGNEDQVLIGNDGGIYRYDWSEIGNFFGEAKDLNDGFGSIQFYKGYYKSEELWAVGGTQDNGTFAMDDSGDPDYYVSTQDGFSCYWGQNNPNLAYLSRVFGIIERRTDFVNTSLADCSSNDPSAPCFLIRIGQYNSDPGATGEGVLFSTTFEVNRVNEDQFYTYTSDGLWRFTWTGIAPDGYTWEKFSTSDIPGISTLAIEENADPTIYTGGSYARLLRFENGATSGPDNYVDLSINVPTEVTDQRIQAITIHPNDPSIIYVGFSSFDEEPRIYKVTNATTNDPVGSPSVWTQIANNLPVALGLNTIALDPSAPEQIIFAGTDYGLYATVDGGNSWYKEWNLPNVAVYDLRMREADRTMFIFTYGRGAWALELSELLTEPLTVGGFIYREIGDPVEQVEIPLCNTTNGINGYYECNNLVHGFNYTVEPHKSINPLNGVTTYDMVLIQQHILGLAILNSPYKIIAADANGSGSVSTLDLVEIRSLILHLSDAMPAGSWRFVPANHIFPNPTDPFAFTFPESITVVNLTANSTNNDFIGIKVGDVNLSANPANVIGGADDREAIQLLIEDQTLAAGETTELAIRVQGFDEQVAYQFNLWLDHNQVEVLDWQAGDLQGFSKENFHLDGQTLRTLWFDNQTARSRSLEAGGVLFRLKIRAKAALASLNNVIRLTDTPNEHLAFNSNGQPTPIQFKIFAAETTMAPYQATITVYPNPFDHQINIAYDDNSPSGTIDLMDIQGRLIHQYTQLPSTLDLSHLETGTYLLRFTTESGHSIKKVIKR